MSKPPLGVLQRLRALVLKNDFESIKGQLESVSPYDAAWVMSRFSVEERARMLSVVPADTGARIFEELTLPLQLELLRLGRLPATEAILRHLDSDKAADVLGALDPTEKDRWLATLPSQEKSEAQSLLAYPADTAGGLMAKEFLSVPMSLTAGEVVARLQVMAPSIENLRVTYVYAVDESGVLKGVLPMRDLALRPRETLVSSFMVTKVATMPVNASKREVAELFRERNLLALPVITDDGKLLGIITADDVMDVIQELANQEMLKLQGVSLEESREMPKLKALKGRFHWLSLNILLDLISASVITFYSDTLTAVIALAYFLPIISDMSGTAGMQAVAVSVRDLALQRILPRDYLRVLRYEVSVGFLNGLMLGTIVGLVAFLLKGIPMLGVLVAISLWVNTIISVIVGGVIPLGLKRLGFDPALASGPILTTITDMMGFFILLSLATVWLPWLKPALR
jgi:magnesium transporter